VLATALFVVAMRCLAATGRAPGCQSNHAPANSSKLNKIQNDRRKLILKWTDNYLILSTINNRHYQRAADILSAETNEHAPAFFCRQDVGSTLQINPAATD
jgi:hypothetical protein